MSVVTSIVILSPLGSPSLTELNAAILHSGWHQRSIGQFRDVGQAAGGPKALQGNVFAAAFNYLDNECFLRLVRALPWQENTHLMISREEDWGFIEYSLLEGATTP